MNGFLYRKNYYRQYQQNHKEKFNISSKKYFSSVMEDDQNDKNSKTKEKPVMKQTKNGLINIISPL